MDKIKRSAGILLHITSLPSAYGIGDLGTEARRFADFLAETGARYWQILPLNPVDSTTGYSPYSSSSSIAGNPLLISPELLHDEDLLTKAELEKGKVDARGKVNFEETEPRKFELLDLAYRRFAKLKRGKLRTGFEDFCHENADWLDPFAAFTVIRNSENKKPWIEWPKPLAKAEPKAVEAFCADRKEEVRKVKWFQFIFFRQWKSLRDYCHRSGVEFVGDLPFYVSRDSADVWKHRKFFELEASGEMKSIAGVPPDYFNENGQLWMMPTYNWKALKRDGYRWWKNRLDHNLTLFDVVRLDHFRAFADYWEVPGGSENAKNGKWKKGPGIGFFDEEVNVDALLAEDLGDLSQEVLDLRDGLGLPGMKVLQFAFGDKLPHSIHAPHNYSPNYFAYTGTHDNNTLVGWYNSEGKKHRKQISAYCGKSINAKNVADEMLRLVMASVARVAILPIQDLLGLDASARLNYPGEDRQDTWRWQLLKDQVKEEHGKKLKRWIDIYGRSFKGLSKAKKGKE